MRIRLRFLVRIFVSGGLPADVGKVIEDESHCQLEAWKIPRRTLCAIVRVSLLTRRSVSGILKKNKGDVCKRKSPDGVIHDIYGLGGWFPVIRSSLP
jgi:hypothetical protein